jgi:glucuronosyltransferase
MPFDDKLDKVTVINCDPDKLIDKLANKVSSLKLVENNKDEKEIPILEAVDTAITLNDNALNHPVMKKLLSDPNTRFDAVIVSNFMAGEAGYYLAYKWQAELALYCSAQSRLPFLSSAMGQPHNPALNTLALLPYSAGSMTFPQRVLNTVMTFAFEHIFRNGLCLYKVNQLLDNVFPGETRPSLLTLERNASLTIAFGHSFILDGWSPTAPNYIQIGMMNCRPVKGFAAGDKIGDFMNKSKNGVVYVSFGSVMRASMMPESRRKLLLSVFARFPDYDFIWKWETETMDDKPSNVMLSKWLPQQDILAHPKLKVFITHAGQSSFQETLCHQKPVVAISIGGDQHCNARESENMGFGIAQLFQTLDEDELYNALDNVLNDPKYTENAQKMGSLLNDQINRPLDRAAWWIEHIMRHPGMYKGRSPVHKLYWFQYFLLDVFAVILVALYIIFKIVKLLCMTLCCKDQTRSKQD